MTYPEGTLERNIAQDRWGLSASGEVLRLTAQSANFEGQRRRLMMRFAWVGDDGLPPVTTHGTLVYPQAFAHIDYGVPLVRNHEWGEIIGSGQVQVGEREAWVEGQLGTDDDAVKAEGTMEMLANAGVELEASVSIRPSTVQIRRGADLTEAEADAFEEAGWPRGEGWAIDYADIIEVSWVLAGAVPDTTVKLRNVATEDDGVTIERNRAMAMLALAGSGE